jgi:hypothetical protein
MNRSIIRGRKFLAIPFISSSLARSTNIVNSRGITTIPPPTDDPSTLGGIVVAVAEKLGIGE